MKRFLFIFVMGLAIIMSSCSDTDLVEIDSQQILMDNHTSVTRSSNDTILYFENREAFDMEVEKIASFASEEEKFAYVRTAFPQFESIQEVYDDALEEMAEMEDVSLEVYNVFQSKYDCLYFPRYLEDAGYYIPMVDLDAAYLVNKNCEVCISGEIFNLRDIDDYQTLVELGRAYYSDESMMPVVEITKIDFKEDMNSVGPEYDSNWSSYKFKKKSGKEYYRKVKLKARRILRKDKRYNHINQFAAVSYIHLEFCYRKASAFGWANYKSSSDIEFRYNPAGRGWSPNSVDDTKGMSSHDYEFEYPIFYQTDYQTILYVFEEASCVATVNFADSHTPLVYNWTMPCLLDSDLYSPTPLKIIGPRYGYYS